MTTTGKDQSVVVPGLFADLPVRPDTTASRVVVNNETLRVVAFAMGAGQELTDHASARAVTVHVVAGALEFEVAGESHALRAGDVVYLAPNERHALLASTDAQFVLVLVATT
jgi:quercetin dioxygenase-like cupin family protein